MDYQQELKRLLTEWQPGHVTQTAYDTAWVARLGDIAPEMSNAALQWICEHQLPDGSWGAEQPLYYHDRVISTLAAMVALTWRGRRSQDKRQIERGLAALERITGGATQGLASDPNGATVGFEMIVPTLIAEAEALGILQHQGDRILWRLQNMRMAKMARLSGLRINRKLSIAYSAEMAGPDCLFLFDLKNLPEANGSIAYSPATTAYYARMICKGDPAALNYLRGVVGKDGGAPLASPFDAYERGWVLWNLGLTGLLKESELRTLCEPHVDALEQGWDSQRGIGFGSGYSVPDGDDSSMVYAVLTMFGRAIDINAMYHYEESTHFRCYDLESNSSVGTNGHFLEAFRQVGLKRDHPAVQKILRFISDNQAVGGYWSDKWHISPYYTTAHLVITVMDYDRRLAEAGVQWLLKTQRPEGSWGFFLPTAEETANVLQALCLYAKAGGAVPRTAVQRGAAWLAGHTEPPYPQMWIAKTLFCSEWVARSEILSALILAAQI